jgi:formylglycine-generating enzyme required for sulfatase activity
MNWAIENGKLTSPSSSSARTFTLAGKPLFDLDNRFCYIKYEQGKFQVDPNYAHYPAIGLNWYGAAAFCNFLSEREGLSPCYDPEDFSCDYSQSGYRLPTNHEWELAARYKTDGTYWGKYDFSGSSQIDEVAWYKENSGQSPNASEYDGTRTHPVGTLQPNNLGIFDMSGNVNEWINDWYKGSYKPSGVNPTGPATGKYKIIRGGSWANRLHMCRVTRFSNHLPHMWGSGGDTYLDIGFRVARR